MSNHASQLMYFNTLKAKSLPRLREIKGILSEEDPKKIQDKFNQLSNVIPIYKLEKFDMR